MSLRRSTTRRVARANTSAPNSAGPNPPRKTLNDVQQGIRVLHEPAGGVPVEIDIVFVPGLGTDPVKSWQHGKTEFNWISDKNGLVKDFTKARLLLFQYESAWIGGLKVKQFIYNIAITLLIALRSSREAKSRRSLVFIGHSMGGLVIAKAITIADSRRDLFPTMFECISGCAFFGTPFDGAPAASVASMLASIGEKIDQATSSKLLEMMKPGDEGLRELKNDFMRLAGKLAQRIELFCFYEEHPTNFAEQVGLPAIFGLAVPKNISEFVSRDSATLTGVDSMGLASNHRNLVKFDGPKDSRFQLVREPLKRIIHGAQLVAKNRFNATRNIDRDTIRDVKKILEGPDAQFARRNLSRKPSATSWLISEKEYQNWLFETSPQRQRVDCMWIRGQVGRGKTSNTLGVLNDFDARIAAGTVASGKAPPLMAYFFCEGAADQSTAEDILKSFLRQLVEQQETLVPYAKHFLKKKKEDAKDNLRSTLQLTVENMWQTIQDMLYDEFIGSAVYFVINNLHILSEDSPSTQKLLGLIAAEIAASSTQDPDRVPVRWLFSSRNTDSVRAALGFESVRLIDLEDEKYEDQVQKELRKHAYAKVSALREEKKYDRDVAYFAHSLIGKRAQNTQWIDIACLQLKALSQSDSRLKVRQILDTMPQDLNMLLEYAWQQVFRQNINVAEKIKEMLRALVLTFEDPTAPELNILAAMSSNDQERSELRSLVEKCKPLLTVRREGETEVKIGFMNIVVKTHLLENSKKLLGLSEDETKWQHGMLAFRSFSHLTGKLADIIVEEEKPEDETDKDNESEDGHGKGATDEKSEANETTKGEDAETVADSQSDWDEDNTEYTDYYDEECKDDDDDEEIEQDPESLAIRDVALAYTVKYWLKHAGHATKEIAEDLISSDEKDFWSTDSQLRRRWLIEFARLGGGFEGFNPRTITSLHIAAGVGFPHLVAALIKNGHQDELHIRDGLDNTPLHFAALYDQVDIVDVLLEAGANIDDGKQDAVQTPLHMAAIEGFVKVMKKLVARGADINAWADDVGPVVNAAIASGSREAVELLIQSGVKLSVEDQSIEDVPPPLAAAAMISDTTLFDYLISACSQQLPSKEYDVALIAAARAGQTEVLGKLLSYNYPTDIYQQAIEVAVEECEWGIVKTILEKTTGLDCHDVFVEAASAWDDQTEVLHAVWRHTNQSLAANTLNEALYKATDCEKEDSVRLLLDEFRADPNAEGEEYGNALTAAANDGTINILKMLLAKGASIDSTAGWPLQAAAAQGHMDVVQELLDRGANPNAFTTNENFEPGTALQAACESGKTEIVELLLQHGADQNLGAGDLTCPLIAATRGGEEKIVELLVNANANVSVSGGPDCSTPLINAALYLPIDSVRLLLNAGSDINLPDNDGDTALIAAAMRGDEECVSFLLDNGADILHTNNNRLNALQVALQEENEECLVILVDAVSKILASLKIAVDAGNEAVGRVLRSAGFKKAANSAHTTGSVDGHNDAEAAVDSASEGESRADPVDSIPAITSNRVNFVQKAVIPNVEPYFPDGTANNTYTLHAHYQSSSAQEAETKANLDLQQSRRRLGSASGGFQTQTNAQQPPQPSVARQDSETSSSLNADYQRFGGNDYSDSSAITPQLLPAIRRKPAPGSPALPSRPSSTERTQSAGALPTIPDSGNDDNNVHSQPTYHKTTTDSSNTSYQAYGYNNSATPPTRPNDYTMPYTSQSYQPYNPRASAPHGYWSWNNQSGQTFEHSQNQQADYSRHNSNDYSYDGLGYDTGNGDWQAPRPPLRLEERRSSSSLFGLKDTFDKAKQYGMNMGRRQ